MHSLRFRLRVFVALLVSVLAVGIVGSMVVEKLSMADAFYFTVVTVATVGYGDIHPATSLGKLLAVFLIVMGVGTFLGVIGNATEMMLHRREQATRLEKLNMVIGVFFSEVGTALLRTFAGADPNLEAVRDRFIVDDRWTQGRFQAVRAELKQADYRVEVERLDLAELRAVLLAKRPFLVGLLENPVLLEHESFTDTLWAVFHLAEELAHRDDLSALPDTDRAHLRGDCNRAYRAIAAEWLDYMAHLKARYPYLFSLAMRTNPFDQDASPVVR